MLLNMNYKYYNIPMPYDSKLLLLSHRISVSYKEMEHLQERLKCHLKGETRELSDCWS